ncbi:tyrosine-type recombinase/integrase [Roseomonas genomospecies 6]|nr:tyrosine-type recombinase/integrase [Roseomonas genomospecies 6]
MTDQTLPLPLRIPDPITTIEDDPDLPVEVREQLAGFGRRYARAKAPRTVRAMLDGVRLFALWCSERGHVWLPATPDTVEAYIEEVGHRGYGRWRRPDPRSLARYTRLQERYEALQRKAAQEKRTCRAKPPTAPESVWLEPKPLKPATLQQHLWAISTAHRAAGYEDPTKHDHTKLAREAHTRERGARQKQARALNEPDFTRIVETLDARIAEHQVILHDLRESHTRLSALTSAAARAAEVAAKIAAERTALTYALRDRALVHTWHDSLRRVSELVAFQWEDIGRDTDGSGTLLVRKSKTDQAKAGKIAWLSPETMVALDTWRPECHRVVTAAVERGAAKCVRMGTADELDAAAALFVSHHRGGVSPLSTVAAVGILNERAAQAGILHRFSGHSIRVGVTQDLLADGEDIAGIAQAGGWETPRMVLRYGERLLAGRNAVARRWKKKHGGE